MQDLNFKEVRLYIAEPNREVRQGIASALNGLGLRWIRKFEKLYLLQKEIKIETPDLVIADVKLADGDVCDMFYAIRHHHIGSNPFIPIVATSMEGSKDLVMKVIDSGADDLLIKPLSAGMLIKRIKRLVHFRKPFVVTTDYIGPSRRETARPQSEDIPLLDVPNTLQAKTTGRGKADHDDIQETIDFAVTVVNEQKMLRHAHQIVYLIDLIVSGFKRKTPGESLDSLIDRLIFVAEDLARRMEMSRFSHVSELCGSLLKVARSIHEKSDNPDSKDLRLLPELSQAIKVAFTSDEKIVSLAHAISASVDKISAS